MGRFLKQHGSNAIFVWTQRLADREDMTECDDKGEIVNVLKEPVAPKPKPEDTPEEEVTPPAGINMFLLAQVKAVKTSKAMAAMAADHGFAFPKGLTLGEMKVTFLEEVQKAKANQANDEAEAKAEYERLEAERAAKDAAEQAAAETK
jgi:hypothetical protein